MKDGGVWNKKKLSQERLGDSGEVEMGTHEVYVFVAVLVN